MGMFDNVDLEFICPFCGTKKDKDEKNELYPWQTKAAENFLNVYTKGSKPKFNGIVINDGWMEIHTYCKKCKKIIEGAAEIKNTVLTGNIKIFRDNKSIEDLRN